MITPELTSVLPKTEGLESSDAKLPVKAEAGLQTIDNESVNFDDALSTEMHTLPDYVELDLEAAATTLRDGLSDGKILPSLPAGVANELEQSEFLAGIFQEIVQDKSPNEMLVGASAIAADASRSALAMPLQNDNEIEIDSLMQDNKLMRTGKGVFSAAEQQAFSIDGLGSAADARAKLSDMHSSGTQPLTADKNTEFSLSAASKTPSIELVTQASQQKLSIGVPVQQARWADNLAGRVSYMLLNNQQSAQISLNPAELGPIEIRLSIQNDQANVNFYAHNATVRDAIEEAFPRLRDMLNENGLNLSQSSVSDQSLSEKQDQSQIAKQEAGTYPFMEEGQSVENEGPTSINLTVGLIDHFV